MATTQQAVDYDVRHYLRQRPRLAQRLPDRSQTWTVHEVDGLTSSLVGTLRMNDIVEHVERVQRGGESDKECWTWRTTAAAQRVCDALAAKPTAPCGDTGVRCVEAGAVYSCTAPECDCRFDRARAVEIADAEGLDAYLEGGDA